MAFCTEEGPYDIFGPLEAGAVSVEPNGEVVGAMVADDRRDIIPGRLSVYWGYTGGDAVLRPPC